MAPRPTTNWKRLPAEVHAAMTQLWAKLLLRRATPGAGRGGVTHHDGGLPQGLAQAPAAGRGRLRAPVHAAATAEQPGEHPPAVWAGRACPPDGLARDGRARDRR